jgi:membrane-associated protease RseP (regulator of RpoE activity)
VLAGAAPTSDPFDLFAWISRFPPDLFRVLSTGLTFSIPLLAFLLSHELGHYITARWYQLDASPPYFIPVPLFPSFIGTMGAFIRLRTVLADRRQLFDVGVAGPLTGFAVALPVLWVGIAGSHELPGHGALGGMLLDIGGQTFALGDSLLTLALRWLLHGRGSAVLLDPLAAAGWFGVFVTMLNLLPISQLDGGHILYGMLPRWHGRAAVAFWILIMVLGWFSWGWIVWAILILALSRGRLGHPPVLDAYRPVPPSRRMLAWGTLALFLLTFTPVPFRM